MKGELLKAMATLKQQGYHSVFLMLTDVNQQATELLYLSDEPAIGQKAWHLKAEGNTLWMPGVMSRKLQMVPPLQNALE